MYGSLPLMTPARSRLLFLVGIITLCVALFASRSSAQSWPTAHSPDVARLRVTVPVGALPPGPATARAIHEKASRVHSVRFRILADTASVVALSVWGAPVHHAPRVTVVVESDRGPRWSTEVDADWSDASERKSTLFVGTTERMSKFSEDWSGTHAEKVIHRLGGPPSNEHCLNLLSHRFVVVDSPTTEEVDAWMACAAKGAHVLLLSAQAPPQLRSVKAGARSLVGAGRVAWVPWDELDFKRLAEDLGATSASAADVRALLNDRGEYIPVRDPTLGLPKAGPLILLTFYVAIVGPIGFWVVVRSRRRRLGMVWIPGSAVVVCSLLYLVTYSWAARPAALHVQRVVLTSPDGSGLASNATWIESPPLKRYELQIPWKEGQLCDQETPQRGLGSVRAHEDRIESKMTVTGTWSGRREGSTGLFDGTVFRWIEPIEAAAPRVLITGERVEVVNDTSRAIRHAIVVVADSRFELAELGAGKRQAAQSAERPMIRAPRTSPVDAVVRRALRNKPLVEGNYLLVVEYEDAAVPDVSTAPPTEVHELEIHAVVGPIPAIGTSP